jgi:NTP pyrophosphatase (non-canonical NTP hydrolase)
MNTGILGLTAILGRGREDEILEIKAFQDLIERIYFEKDSKRGKQGTFAWLVEEVGELSRALRKGDEEMLKQEFADVFAWLVSLASLCGIDLGKEASAKYSHGCPKCEGIPCVCEE